MPAPTDCLAALLGLSRGGSPCFPLPAAPVGGDLLEITASGSGYYLDLLEGLSFRTATGNGAPDLYERLSRARALGALNLRNALRPGTGARFRESGPLGAASTNGQAGTIGPLTLRTRAHEAGALRLLSVRLATTTTVFNVPLLLDGVLIATLASTNAAPQTLPVTALIPLDGLPHTLDATLPAGVRPLANLLHCSPCAAGTPWAQSLLRTLDGVSPATSAQGFSLQVREVCLAPETACYAAERDEELRAYLGQALAYTAGALLVTDLLTDARVDRYTMLEPKTLPALGARYDEQAAKAVAWLNGSDGLPRITHPCYVCQAPGWHPTIQSVA